LYKMLGMAKHLVVDLRPLVDDGRIKLSNAIEVAKLPPEEQPTWTDRAMTMGTQEFTEAVASRMKSIKEARRSGRKEGPEEFKPHPFVRKVGEIKKEHETRSARDELITKHRPKSTQEAFDLAIDWVVNMDPDSKAVQVAKNDQREAEAKAEKQKKQLERTKQREEEAAKTRAKLEEQIAGAGAGAPA
jgi:hypothetical protein